MTPPTQTTTIFRHSAGAGWQAIPTRVVSESNVSLTINGETWISFLCTPQDLEALAAGFLFNEGLIDSATEISSLRVCADGSNVDVWLNRTIEKPAQWRRTSGCGEGVTAPTRINKFQIPAATVNLTPEIITRSMEHLMATQELYHTSRGIHCSALSNGDHILVFAEDIGRHNTLDKLAGLLLLRPEEISPRLVLTTGRISSEMLQKSARLGAAAVISHTSPTALSIQLAEEFGITLIGYARRSQFTVYAGAQRLVGTVEILNLTSQSEI